MALAYRRSVTETWTLDASDGELIIRTGVAGRAARMGHRLTIAMTRWQAMVNWGGAEPVTAELVVEVDSFEVLRGEGGVKGLSVPEKVLVRSNALKSLSVSRFPEIRFTADTIDRTRHGYRLTGALDIRGRSLAHVIDLCTKDLGDSWRMFAESRVRQSDYGIKPHSLLMGSVQVADEVTVSFTAVRAKDD
ncbi:YceI family protein [Mycobacterium lacus]|uniref:Polyisoprenoid-binding protein n=1 Tax=Mycobacterium lacus TaxID=169765 RepID=A0A1X1YAP0_9MYCO|nr:YceI family protein [Mycobacterium lacus]MCV7123798.1 YceI family protein [Mycobacterium lacus]ORW08158.1 S-adenosyl-L-methionine-dependent methyltransferase [Mycobacterium lacus]BBX96555.1 polyisoprenoid-binding protein [Mycobacterium lacus]